VNKIAKLSIVVCGVLAAGTAMASGYDRDGDNRDYHERARRARAERPNPYVGFSFGELRYNEDGLNTIKPTVAMLRIGAPLGRNLSIEGRVAGSFGNSSTDGYGLQLRSMYAGYLKGSLPLASGFSLYALGGIGAVNLERDFGLGTTHDTGLSAGVGAEFDLTGGASLNVEWVRLPGGNNLGYDYTNDMASIGVSWRF
jgi:opacity protein-like surface antigen